MKKSILKKILEELSKYYIEKGGKEEKWNYLKETVLSKKYKTTDYHFYFGFDEDLMFSSPAKSFNLKKEKMVVSLIQNKKVGLNIYNVFIKNYNENVEIEKSEIESIFYKILKEENIYMIFETQNTSWNSTFSFVGKETSVEFENMVNAFFDSENSLKFSRNQDGINVVFDNPKNIYNLFLNPVKKHIYLYKDGEKCEKFKSIKKIEFFLDLLQSEEESNSLLILKIKDFLNENFPTIEYSFAKSNRNLILKKETKKLENIFLKFPYRIYIDGEKYYQFVFNNQKSTLYKNKKEADQKFFLILQQFLDKKRLVYLLK